MLNKQPWGTGIWEDVIFKDMLDKIQWKLICKILNSALQISLTETLSVGCDVAVGCRTTVHLTLMENFVLHMICQLLSKKERNVSENTGQGWARNLSLHYYLKLFPEWFHFLTMLGWAQGKNYFKDIAEKKKLIVIMKDSVVSQCFISFWSYLSGVVLEFFGPNCCFPSPALVVPVCDQPHTGAGLAGARHSVLHPCGIFRPRATSSCSAFWEAVCPHFERYA